VKGWTSSVLPDRVLVRISCEQRNTLGKAGVTMAEANEKAAVKSEKQLQKLCRAYLMQHHIPVNVPAFGRKSTTTPGWPDFTFPLPPSGRLCAIEFKVGANHTTPEQARCIDDLQRCGAVAVVVRTFEEFLRVVKV